MEAEVQGIATPMATTGETTPVLQVGVSLSLFPEAQASVAFGAPVNISLIDGMWGVSVFRAPPVQEAVATALAKFEQGVVAALPYAGRLAGLAFGLLAPSAIAPDDKSMMPSVVMTLPADKVTRAPIASLPTQAATVEVHSRVADVVQNEKQHLAVVGGVPASVPVVDAKPTKRPGVFTAEVVPGRPALNVKVDAGKPVAVSTPKGITPEKDDIRPAGFTAGGNSRDAVIRFPKESGQAPVYVSVTEVLTAAQVKQRQAEENARQQEWNAAHPVEVAQQELDTANQEHAAAEAAYTQATSRNKAAIAGFKPYSSVDYGKEKAELTRIEAQMALWAKQRADAVTNGDGLSPQGSGHAVYMHTTYEMSKMKPQLDAKRATVSGYEKTKKELDESTAVLNTALESRKLKEKKKKDAEAKLDEEKKKPRKGVKEFGHDYLPAPKTEEIIGLGELKRAPKRTPKKGGGGLRDRWKGDKGRKIYEWDSQHGELEGYRSSDGQHIGAFDANTGTQVKDADPERNIKDYL
ncbi:colicin-like bacteriocin tRNase domain-containing protein [Erwinia sp. AnSW2-5]|uniref:colicin-like bacteriocin tRNase domain-containing protein n=1 Tax=Erwinia sp. AnSW2-5 TaxID=3367692 RepID=UPI00385A84DE